MLNFGLPATAKPTCSFTLNRASPQTRGLIGWWPGSPAGGNTYFDMSGRGYHGTLTSFNSTNISGWTPGKDGGTSALVFDGTGDLVDLPTGITTLLSNNIVSVTCWVKVNAYSSYNCVFDNEVAGNARNFALFFVDNSNGYVSAGNTNGAAAVFSPAWTTGNWEHCAFVCDGTTIKTYRNGVQNSSTAGAIGAGFGACASFQIGGNPSGGGSAWIGGVEDFRVYNRVLSDADVFAIVNPATRWQLRYTPQRILYGIPVAYNQTAYRFRNDDGSESLATWLAAENTAITRAALTNTRLRVQENVVGNPSTQAVKLQYRKVGTTTRQTVSK